MQAFGPPGSFQVATDGDSEGPMTDLGPGFADGIMPQFGKDEMLTVELLKVGDIYVCYF